MSESTRCPLCSEDANTTAHACINKEVERLTKELRIWKSRWNGGNEHEELGIFDCNWVSDLKQERDRLRAALEEIRTLAKLHDGEDWTQVEYFCANALEGK